MRQRGSPTTGVTAPCPFLPRTRNTPAVMTLSPNFATWSRRCTAPISR